MIGFPNFLKVKLQEQDKLSPKFKISLIPKDYEPLSYLQKTVFDTSYIDTGYYASQNTKCELNVEFLKFCSDSPMFVFGWMTTLVNFNTSFGLVLNSNTSSARDTKRHFAFKFNNTGISNTIQAEFNTVYKLIWDRTGGCVNDQKFIYQNDSDFKTLGSLYLFWINNLTSSRCTAKHRIYSCKFYENNSLAMDLLPVRQKSTKALGMFDLVSGKFFPVSKQSSFIGA